MLWQHWLSGGLIGELQRARSTGSKSGPVIPQSVLRLLVNVITYCGHFPFFALRSIIFGSRSNIPSLPGATAIRIEYHEENIDKNT